MAILGGRGTFVGPFVGAAVFLVLQEYLSIWTPSWLLVTGAIFIVFVILLPEGIWGTLKSLLAGRQWFRAGVPSKGS
jgi:branched-chain amino acid transport system permease protein